MSCKINKIVKRAADIVCSLIILTILSPVLAVAMLLIKITMPGPVFFLQERVGKDGKNFNIYKLRTMKQDKRAEEAFDVTKDSQRITSVGKLLRRFKIDEVVQLINVLKGEMSMVGPRPTLKIQTDNYNDFERQRLKMSPGMTGLAQVNGNVALTWEERIVYDVEYVNNFSVWLDFVILVKTALIVVFGEEKFKKKPSERHEDVYNTLVKKS